MLPKLLSLLSQTSDYTNPLSRTAFSLQGHGVLRRPLHRPAQAQVRGFQRAKVRGRAPGGRGGGGEGGVQGGAGGARLQPAGAQPSDRDMHGVPLRLCTSPHVLLNSSV